MPIGDTIGSRIKWLLYYAAKFILQLISEIAIVLQLVLDDTLMISASAAVFGIATIVLKQWFGSRENMVTNTETNHYLETSFRPDSDATCNVQNRSQNGLQRAKGARRAIYPWDVELIQNLFTRLRSPAMERVQTVAKMTLQPGFQITSRAPNAHDRGCNTCTRADF